MVVVKRKRWVDRLAGVVISVCGLALAAQAAAGDLAEMVTSMDEGQWKELPDTSMRAVLPARDTHPHWGRQGPTAVTRAWSGAAYDTRRNRLVVTGGGHGNYGGNEVYEFDLEAMRWERATEPSRHEVDPAFAHKASPERFYRTVDGTPVSRHTYDGLLYLPNVDQVFMWGGSLYSVGASYDPHAWLYDMEQKTWTQGAAAGNTRIQVVTAYDPETGRALVEYGEGLYGYDPVDDAWTVISRRNSRRHGHVGDYDPDRRLFIQAQVPNSTDAGIAYYDLNHPGAGRRLADVTGEVGFREALVPGMAFHPPTGFMVLWEGWKETWVLDPDSWRMRKLANAPGPGPDHYGTDSHPVKGRYKTNGIYGRWAYVPEYEVFIGYGHVDDNVWLYRLPDEPFQWEPRESGGAATCADGSCSPDAVAGAGPE